MTNETRRRLTEKIGNRLGRTTVCAQCGYRFVSGDAVLHINQTGDCIHRDCFPDYFDDNREEFCDEFEL